MTYNPLISLGVFLIDFSRYNLQYITYFRECQAFFQLFSSWDRQARLVFWTPVSVPASLFYAYIIAPNGRKVKHYFRLFLIQPFA
jgi:hypothetical protein